jgi:hypothetical protein
MLIEENRASPVNFLNSKTPAKNRNLQEFFFSPRFLYSPGSAPVRMRGRPDFLTSTRQPLPGRVSRFFTKLHIARYIALRQPRDFATLTLGT